MSEVNGSAESTILSPGAVQPETDFAELYYGIISKLYDFKCRQISNDVKSALIDMRRLKRETDNIQERILFSYKIPPVRCAYLYAYSVLHSVMVYTEFSNFIKANKNFLLPACSRDSLKMCCLGGGPGTEAVAISKAINDIILESCPKSADSVLEVHVTMVDKLPHWRREESAGIDAVNTRSNILDSKRIVLQSGFMKGDLLKPFEKSLKEKIIEADIVTIVKLGTSIQEKSPENCSMELQNVMKSVIENMRDGSCLFMLDNAGGSVFYHMKKVLHEMKHSSLLKSSLHKEYILDINTVKKFENLWKSKKNANYHPMLPTAKGKVSSCMWMKNINCVTENSVDEKNIAKKSNNDGNTSMFLRERGEDTPICNQKTSFREAKSEVTRLSVIAKIEEPEKKCKHSKKKEKRTN